MILLLRYILASRKRRIQKTEYGISLPPHMRNGSKEFYRTMISHQKVNENVWIAVALKFAHLNQEFLPIIM